MSDNLLTPAKTYIEKRIFEPAHALNMKNKDVQGYQPIEISDKWQPKKKQRNQVSPVEEGSTEDQ